MADAQWKDRTGERSAVFIREVDGLKEDKTRMNTAVISSSINYHIKFVYGLCFLEILMIAHA